MAIAERLEEERRAALNSIQRARTRARDAATLKELQHQAARVEGAYRDMFFTLQGDSYEERRMQRMDALEKEYQNAAQAVERKTEEVEANKSELAVLVSKSLAAAPDKRAALVSRHAELVNLSGLLCAELRELEERRAVAHLAIYLDKERAALAEVERLQEKQTAMRHELNAAMDAKRHFQTAFGLKPSDDRLKERGEMEANIARLKAEAEIITRNLTRAAKVLEDTRRELEEVRGEAQNG